MDDFRLKVFITAARTLSFTRAAGQLDISQPAVSKHVAELETRYGLQLFTRRGSRLELTDAGRCGSWIWTVCRCSATLFSSMPKRIRRGWCVSSWILRATISDPPSGLSVSAILFGKYRRS